MYKRKKLTNLSTLDKDDKIKSLCSALNLKPNKDDILYMISLFTAFSLSSSEVIKHFGESHSIDNTYKILRFLNGNYDECKCQPQSAQKF